MMKYPLFPPIEIGIENCSSDIEEIIEYYWRFYSKRFKLHGKLFLKTKLLCYYVSEFKIYGMKMPINVSLQRYSSLVIITFPIVIDNTNCLLCLMSCKPVRGCSVVNFFSWNSCCYFKMNSLYLDLLQMNS